MDGAVLKDVLCCGWGSVEGCVVGGAVEWREDCVNISVSVRFCMQDGSAALKQMLKIGVEEAPSNELVNKKSYGKQVSIQELFEGELTHAAWCYFVTNFLSFLFCRTCLLLDIHVIVMGTEGGSDFFLSAVENLTSVWMNLQAKYVLQVIICATQNLPSPCQKKSTHAHAPNNNHTHTHLHTHTQTQKKTHKQ